MNKQVNRKKILPIYDSRDWLSLEVLIVCDVIGPLIVIYYTISGYPLDKYATIVGAFASLASLVVFLIHEKNMKDRIKELLNCKK